MVLKRLLKKRSEDRLTSLKPLPQPETPSPERTAESPDGDAQPQSPMSAFKPRARRPSFFTSTHSPSSPESSFSPMSPKSLRRIFTGSSTQSSPDQEAEANPQTTPPTGPLVPDLYDPDAEFRRIYDALNLHDRGFPTDQYVVTPSGRLCRLVWDHHAPIKRALRLRKLQAGSQDAKEAIEKAVRSVPNVTIFKVNGGEPLEKGSASMSTLHQNSQNRYMLTNFLRSHPTPMDTVQRGAAYHVVGDQSFRFPHLKDQKSPERAVEANEEVLHGKDRYGQDEKILNRARLYNAYLLSGAPRPGKDWYGHFIDHIKQRLVGQCEIHDSYAIDHRNELVFAVTWTFPSCELHWQPFTTIFDAVTANFFNHWPPLGHQIRRQQHLLGDALFGSHITKLQNENKIRWLDDLLKLATFFEHDLTPGSLAYYDGFVVQFVKDGQHETKFRLLKKPQSAYQHDGALLPWENVLRGIPPSVHDHIQNQTRTHQFGFVKSTEGTFEYLKDGDRVSVARNDGLHLAQNDSRKFLRDYATSAAPGSWI